MAEDIARWCCADLDEAIVWTRERNGDGIRCIIDPLGELALDEAASETALREAIRAIEAIAENDIRASISIKPTALGVRYDQEGCQARIEEIALAAWRKGLSVEIDMEARRYLDPTMAMATGLRKKGNGGLSLALQTYLFRTPMDAKRMNMAGVKVRLVKGAYAGDIKDHDEVRAAMWDNIDLLHSMGRPFSIGTHDPSIIRKMERHGALQGLVEIGMLKGIGDETKLRLAERGWSVAEYVPYGEDSYAYVARRRNYLRKMSELGLKPVP